MEKNKQKEKQKDRLTYDIPTRAEVPFHHALPSFNTGAYFSLV